MSTKRVIEGVFCVHVCRMGLTNNVNVYPALVTYKKKRNEKNHIYTLFFRNVSPFMLVSCYRFTIIAQNTNHYMKFNNSFIF